MRELAGSRDVFLCVPIAGNTPGILWDTGNLPEVLRAASACPSLVFAQKLVRLGAPDVRSVQGTPRWILTSLLAARRSFRDVHSHHYLKSLITGLKQLINA